jgi:hypothetical protein
VKNRYIIFLLLSLKALVLSAQSDTAVLLREVPVYSSGENPAFPIVRKLRSSKVEWEKQQAAGLKLYIRYLDPKRQEVVFETVSNAYSAGGAWKQEIEAIRTFKEDRANFGNSAQVSLRAEVNLKTDFDFDKNRSRGPFEQWPELDLNKYWIDIWNDFELGRHCAEPVRGLLSFGTLKFYRWNIDELYRFQGEDFVVLSFSPITGSIGWSGTITVNETKLEVLSSEIKLLAPSTFDGEELAIAQEFAYDGGYRISKQKIDFDDGKMLESKVIDVGSFIPERAMRPMQLASIPEELKNDVQYWNEIRPKDDQIDAWTTRQDSIIRYLNSDEYLDSADAVYNKFHWYEPLVTGVGYRKRSEGTHFWYSPLMSQFNFVGIGGTRWIPQFIATKRFDSDRSVSLTGRLNYGFKNNDLKGSLNGSVVYNPLRNASIHVGLGDEYTQITQSIDLTGLFARSNYVRKTFFDIYQRYEWFNGFYTRSGFEYSTRRSIDGLEFASWSNLLFGELNQPGPFETYRVAQLGVEVLIRPYQRYYLKGRRKIVLSSKWPDIRVQFQQGIPKLFGSDVGYSKYEFALQHTFKPMRLGEMHYRFSSGGFLNDPSSVRFIEYKWFRGGDPYVLTNPIYTTQSLRETFASPGVYFMANAMHHFDGILLGQVPLVRRLKVGAALGGAAVIVPEQGVNHWEANLGVERKVKWFDSPMRIGLYYSPIPTELGPGYRWKIGIDLRDTFSDRWNY